jgi:hypothetical protein
LSAPFDIFKQQSDGNTYWVERAEDLEDAKARARVLAENFPGQYLVVDNEAGEKFFIGTRPN